MSIIHNVNLRFKVDLPMAEDKVFNYNYLQSCSTICARKIETYYYDTNDTSRYYSERVQIGEIEVRAYEFCVNKKLYVARWEQWKVVLGHYKYWKHKHTLLNKRDIARKLKEAYKNKYFRESILYVRKNGSLDEKIESYFMGYYKHIFFKPVYAIVMLLYRIKSSFKRVNKH